MIPIVVDASVAAKWYVPEALSDRAETLLDGTFDLQAPDLIVPELGNVLWKKIGRDELELAKAGEILAAFRRIPMHIVPSAHLIDGALEIATAHGRTVYDGLYVSLAVAIGGTLVTADERLVRALAGGPLGASVRSLAA